MSSAGFLISWLLPLGLALAAAGAAADCPAVAVLTTTDGADGQPRITVAIDGGDRLFVLDTGAPAGVLRESVAEELGLARKPIPLNAVTGVGGRPFEEQTVVPKVGLGGLTLTDVAFLIQPRSHAAEPDMAGLIGADLFSRYDLDLDLRHHRIALLAPGTCRPGGMASMALTVLPSHHVIAAVGLDGTRIDALIDSGASQSIMTLDAARRFFGIDPEAGGGRPVGEIVAADGGRVPAYVHLFRSLSLGSVALGDVPVVLMGDETKRMHRPLSDGDGKLAAGGGGGLPDFILGMTQLRRLHLIIAYADRMLYVADAPS